MIFVLFSCASTNLSQLEILCMIGTDVGCKALWWDQVWKNIQLPLILLSCAIHMSHNSLKEIMLWWTFVRLRWVTYFCVWIHSVIILQVRNVKMIQSWKFTWHVQPLWPTIWLNRMITIVVAMYVLCMFILSQGSCGPKEYQAIIGVGRGDKNTFEINFRITLDAMSPLLIKIVLQLMKSHLHVAGQRGHSLLLHIKWTLSCSLLQPRMRGKNTKRTHKNKIFYTR